MVVSDARTAACISTIVAAATIMMISCSSWKKGKRRWKRMTDTFVKVLAAISAFMLSLWSILEIMDVVSTPTGNSSIRLALIVIMLYIIVDDS
jgi:amino acid transporter